MKDMKNGRIELIIGPMYAGKTTELLRYAKRYQLKKRILGINHSSDVRYTQDGKIVSHDFQQFDNTLSLANLADIFNTPENLTTFKNSDIILIDELQFFNDALKFVPLFADKYNKIVIASGLDGDFNRKPFRNVCELIPKAESVHKITAFCDILRDGTPAPFTKHLIKSHNKNDENDENEVDGKKAEVEVGGKETYVAVSRAGYCNNKNVGKFQLIIGPMFSGKTTELMRTGNRYKQIGKRVMNITHINMKSVSHVSDVSDVSKIGIGIGIDGNPLSSPYLIIDDLNNIEVAYNEIYKNADIILIDQVHLFSNASKYIIKMVEKDCKTVIAAGLDGDYQQRPYGDIANLIPLCDKLEKLSSVCSLSPDYQEASFTRRITHDYQQDLENKNIYIACSRFIYNLPEEQFIKLTLQKYKK